MIISQTPFRISFVGGGTDYPSYYEQYGGAVLSATINKYCYIIVRYLPPFFNHAYRIRYTKNEEVQTMDAIQHPSVRECLRFADINGIGIEMVHTADMPAQSGTGSSSAFTVGFLHALYALLGKESVTKRQLARDAIHVEQKLIKENVGSQDQVAAAFGGLNKIEFFKDGIKVTGVSLQSHKERYWLLQKHLLLFFTGFTRIASEVAAEQIRNVPQRSAELHTMKEMVYEALAILESDRPLNEFGKLLHEGWTLKKKLSSRITTPDIDAMYETGLRYGAIGGKLLGAGSGGCILFFAPPETHEKIIKKLTEEHGKLIHIPFQFEQNGSQIARNIPEWWNPLGVRE